MISNLQKKLAAISKDMKNSESKDTKPPLDFTCSVYKNEYDNNHVIGNVPIKNIYSRDINLLNDICFTKSVEHVSLEDVVFFDTETTGLGTGTSTAAFLAGTGYFEGNKFITNQFLMNDYYQESDMLSNLNYILKEHKAVISYNGKAFDSHIVNSRSILNRLPRLLNEKIQMDLLHSSRRLYKRRLQSCSMSSIEENILDVHRTDDIPGSEIPEIFFNYIKYGDNTMLTKVIEHNLQDVISMVAIADKLLDAYDNPQTLKYKEDIFSQGRIFEKLNFPLKAKLCYNVLGNYPPALCRMGYMEKFQNNYNEAIKYFEALSKIHRFDAEADIELAKIYEHKLKDIEKALKYTKIALEKATSLLSGADTSIVDEIKKRKQRLENKLIF